MQVLNAAMLYWPMPNVLYVPSTVAERNIIELLESKLSDICKVYADRKDKKGVLIQTCSATNTGIPTNSIDYIFTDPPLSTGYQGNLIFNTPFAYNMHYIIKLRFNSYYSGR